MTANGEITLAVYLVAVLIFGNMQKCHFLRVVVNENRKRQLQRLSVFVSVRDSNGVEVVNFTVSKYSRFCV